MTLLEALRARQRIAPYLRRTPLVFSPWLSEHAGADVFLKLESLQRASSFKSRGAFNAVMAMKSLANIQVFFRFKGQASHAAGSPHLGRSALDAVELTNVGVNYLREHMPIDCRVHYAITNSGGISPNVVQASADVLYLVRAPNVRQAQTLYERVCNVARGAALMTDTTLTIEVDKACSKRVKRYLLLSATGVLSRPGDQLVERTHPGNRLASLLTMRPARR